MTIHEVVSLLQEEQKKNLPSRFHCRAIMVKSIAQYSELLSELKKIANIRVVKTSEIFSGADVMPKYRNLEAAQYQNEWVILTGVSEYLRLFAKKEAADRRFADLWNYNSPAQNEACTGRIIIPLWGCEAQWFDSTLNLSGDPRQQDYYFDCTDADQPDPEFDLLVLSGMFEQYISRLESEEGNLIIGLRDWFEYWENPGTNTKFVLLTKRSKGITATSGKITVHVMNDVMSFIKENIPGSDALTEDDCSDEMQAILFDYALKGTPVKEALLKILNVSVFSGVDVMGKWDTLHESHKRFIALWYKMYPDGSYLNHCFAVSSEITEIPALILHEIFNVRLNKPIWVHEFKSLCAAMALKPDHAYFEELDDIPEYETRLEFLSCATREERIYLLHMVGQWIRKDPAQVDGCQKLREVFPSLSAYLSRELDVLKTDLGDYISRYKSYKLANNLPEDEDIYFGGVQTQQYDYRYSALSEYSDQDTVVLWVDALGVEWLSLLYWGLINNCDGTIQAVVVTQATLPTETCYNDQWNAMSVPHNKLDKLDKLAHKGVVDEPDYYTCIEEQLSFVSGLHERVSSLMKEHHRVIITGDHGTSRLAARFFHERQGCDAPKDAAVGGHGRFCTLPVERKKVPIMPGLRAVNGDEGIRYLVFENYDHFKQSGFAAGNDEDNAIYGEVHGGATPEEMLVPVIVIDSNKDIPLTGVWTRESVKIRMKKAKFEVTFSKPVAQLTVKAAGIVAETIHLEAGTKWNVIFPNIKASDHPIPVEMVADGQIISMPNITVQGALSGGMGDLL